MLGCLPKDGAAFSEKDPLTSISNQDNQSLLDSLQANLT